MTPNQLTTILAEPHGRQFDMPYKLMLFDMAMLKYASMVRRTLRDPRRRKEFLRSIHLQTQLVTDPYKRTETVEELPKTVFANGINFDYVGTEDGVYPYAYVSSPAAIPFLTTSKYTRKNQRHYSFLNSRVQLYPAFGTPVIRVDGVFVNLKQVFELNSKTQGGDFEEDFWNADMRVADDILQLVIEAMRGSDLRIEPTENDKEIA